MRVEGCVSKGRHCGVCDALVLLLGAPHAAHRAHPGAGARGQMGGQNTLIKWKIISVGMRKVNTLI